MNIIKFLQSFIFLSVVLSAFDGLNIRSGILQQGFIYPTLIGIVIFFILKLKKDKKIYINNIYKKYLWFLLIIFVNTLFNINNILGVEYKGITAESRVVGNILVLIIISLMILYYYNILLKKENIIHWLYKAIFYSFFISMLYSLIQLLGMFDNQTFINIYHILEPHINIQMKPYEMDYPPTRIIGFSKEASTYGNYIAVIFPWLIIGLLYFKRKILSICAIVISLIFVIFSYSRIAYICIGIELIIILLIIKRCRELLINIKVISGVIICLLIIMFIIVEGEYINTTEIVDKITDVMVSFTEEASIGRVYSNLTRIGLQYAALNIFMDNVLFGIGIGQFQFQATSYIPIWAYFSPEIQGFMDAGDKNFFYGTFNTHIRVLAEVGIIGFILWCNIIYQGLKNYIIVTKNINKTEKNLIKLITMSYVASIIGFINFDIFEFFYFWLLLILSNVLIYRIKNNKEI